MLQGVFATVEMLASCIDDDAQTGYAEALAVGRRDGGCPAAGTRAPYWRYVKVAGVAGLIGVRA